jgi:nucleoside-diphosphate-sugar epimerase
VNVDTVLVTGGAGRLGRYVVAELAPHCKVSVLDRAQQSASAIDFPVDVMDLEALGRAMRGFDAVVHLAAIDSSVTAPPEVVFDVNVRGTWNVLHAAREAGVRRTVITSSSSAAGIDYTNPRMPPLYLPIDEAHPLRPSSAYGLSKQIDEQIAQGFGRRPGMEVMCLRPAWVMVPDSVRRLKAERQGGTGPAAMPGHHREPWPLLRSYVAPEDAARAYRLALEAASAPHGLFIITAADTFEPEATLVHLEKTYGARIEVRKPELYARQPRASAWDISRAREILGWSPSQDWDAFAARF